MSVCEPPPSHRSGPHGQKHGRLPRSAVWMVFLRPLPPVEPTSSPQRSPPSALRCQESHSAGTPPLSTEKCSTREQGSAVHLVDPSRQKTRCRFLYCRHSRRVMRANSARSVIYSGGNVLESSAEAARAFLSANHTHRGLRRPLAASRPSRVQTWAGLGRGAWRFSRRSCDAS